MASLDFPTPVVPHIVMRGLSIGVVEEGGRDGGVVVWLLLVKQIEENGGKLAENKSCQQH